jgi:hypothetical protein
MTWVTEQIWQRVESLGPGRSEPDPLRVVDGVGGGAAARYRSAAGERAVLVPVRHLEGSTARSPVAVEAGALAEGDVLFTDPASASSALSLLGHLGASAGPVHIALPVGTDPGGLVREAGIVRVVCPPGRLEYALFRPGPGFEASKELFGSAPEVGEAPDVLERRAEWFRKRSGGRDGG